MENISIEVRENRSYLSEIDHSNLNRNGRHTLALKVTRLF